MASVLLVVSGLPVLAVYVVFYGVKEDSEHSHVPVVVAGVSRLMAIPVGDVVARLPVPSVRKKALVPSGTVVNPKPQVRPLRF